MTSPTTSMSQLQFYNTHVEISMALREVDRTYYIHRGCLASSVTQSQEITMFWKPPGALQWIEKCRTEQLPGMLNLQFATKGYVDIDEIDVSSILLKFCMSSTGRMGGLYHVKSWSTIETSLDRLLTAGPKGLDFVLPLQLELWDEVMPEAVERACSKTMPGILFLRAEVLQPPAFGIFLQFGIQVKPSGSNENYFFELYKLNQGNLLEVPNAYTLIYRSDTGNAESSDYFGVPVYFLEPRITNGDEERVLKLEIFKKKSNTKKAFALTTLGSLFRAPIHWGTRVLSLDVDRVDEKTKKCIKVILKLYQQVSLQPLEYYYKVGLKMLRVYAVDFSRSNWNIYLHKRILHESHNGMTPYEEALELVSETMKDMAEGDSVFYSFGNLCEPFVTTFPERNHLKSLLETYRQALCSEMMSTMQVTEDTESGLPEGAAAYCIPSTCKPSSSAKRKTLMAPLFNDIVALISTRITTTFERNANFEYYPVFILTDGQISDVEKSMEILAELANLPVSIVFIGIGLGDFYPLLNLENAWKTPVQDKFPCRRFIHVVHFRSIFDWNTSLMYYKMRSDPIDIFRKDILTAVREHALAYMRIFLPEV